MEAACSVVRPPSTRCDRLQGDSQPAARCLVARGRPSVFRSLASDLDPRSLGPTAANGSDLLVLRGKAEKSEWTRGLFISINGFSDLAADSFRIGRKANLIGMSARTLV